MEPFSKKTNQFLELEKWQKRSAELVVGFTSRNGGVSKEAYSSLNCGLHVHDVESDVLQNRRKLAKLIDIPLENWIMGEQVHDIKIKIVDENDKGSGAFSSASSIPAIDGVLTKTSGVLLSAFFADCIPLYFFDPEAGIIGIAHAGWKGTVGGIASEMVTAFVKQGSNKDNILVTVGPGISKEHYEVDERVISKIDEKYREKVLTTQDNRSLLDLKELNREILLQSGILSHNIDITSYCTYRDEALFFSHRRDQGKTGRMLGFIGFRE